MQENSLTALPLDLQVRIANCLSDAEQLPLMQSCRTLHHSAFEARRTRLAQQSRRPGRMSNDPFPTLLEHVQGGGKVHAYAMQLPNVLRACAGLTPPDGMLRQAAERRVRTWSLIAPGAVLEPWSKCYYRGETDKRGRPDGVGFAMSYSISSPDSVYIGDWRHGKRCGVGTQFFWESPEHKKPYQGGWYEGEWYNDQISGAGMLVGADLRYQEGLWKHGQPVGTQPVQTARTVWSYLNPTHITGMLIHRRARSK